MYQSLAILATFAFLYSIVAGRAERSPISGPLLFILFGILMGPLGLGWLTLSVTSTELRILADLALATLLFSDAANVKKGPLESNLHIPVRMLAIGLPGVIGLGFVFALLMFDALSVWEAAILATMLAATDAALGKPVVTNKSVPPRFSASLNVESGLNDGICVPVLLVFITLATAAGESADAGRLFLKLGVQEIGVGLVVGLGVTALGTWLAYRARDLGWITELWVKLSTTMLALSCFALAQSFHGSGYIAAFVGGLVFGYLTRRKAHELTLDTEGVGETLGMLTWILFGSVVVATVIDTFSWAVFGYALLSLTVIRVLPIVVSLAGSGERLTGKLFLGWFGPRGLASIVFAIIVLNNEVANAKLLALIVACTVFLSAIAHGISANPFIKTLVKSEKRGKSKAQNKQTSEA